MTWTTETLPANWGAIRDSWWTWHIVRTGISVLAMAILLAGIIADREPVRDGRSAQAAAREGFSTPR